MAKKTQKKMTEELYQAVIGIPENPDENGLIGDFKEMKGMIQAQNGRQRKTEKKVNILVLSEL